jgi:Flp pilus assembly protein CpaB
MKTKTIILIAVIVAFLTTFAIAMRAQAAILGPIPVMNCTLCAPSTKSAPKKESNPVIVAHDESAEIDRLRNEVVRLTAILATLQARK